jgi:hypothetical protein
MGNDIQTAAYAGREDFEKPFFTELSWLVDISGSSARRRSSNDSGNATSYMMLPLFTTVRPFSY